LSSCAWRQSVLRPPNPPTFEVVLNEAALHCMARDRAVAERQLRHLVAAARLPDVSLQLLAYSTGPHVGMAGPFTIYTFSDPVDPAIVHLEHSVGDVYLDHPGEVDKYRAKLSRLRSLAGTSEESVAFLLDVLGEHSRGPARPNRE